MLPMIIEPPGSKAVVGIGAIQPECWVPVRSTQLSCEAPGPGRFPPGVYVALELYVPVHVAEFALPPTLQKLALSGATVGFRTKIPLRMLSVGTVSVISPGGSVCGDPLGKPA